MGGATWLLPCWVGLCLTRTLTFTLHPTRAHAATGGKASSGGNSSTSTSTTNALVAELCSVLLRRAGAGGGYGGSSSSLPEERELVAAHCLGLVRVLREVEVRLMCLRLGPVVWGWVRDMGDWMGGIDEGCLYMPTTTGAAAAHRAGEPHGEGLPVLHAGASMRRYSAT